MVTSTMRQTGFLSRDPIGYSRRDKSLYQYVRARPLIGVDPRGNDLVIFPGPEHNPGSGGTFIGGGVHLLNLGDPIDYNPLTNLSPSGLCNGVGACAQCDMNACLAESAKYQAGFYSGSLLALDSLQGELEEHGLGPFGGRCHLWSSGFKKCCPDFPSPKSCLKDTNAVIRLDGSEQYYDHNINVIKNGCTGKCTIVGDGFWGGLWGKFTIHAQ